MVNFAEIMLKRFDYVGAVPVWPNSDYDTFYVFTIDWKATDKLEFDVRSEGFGLISESCPTAVEP